MPAGLDLGFQVTIANAGTEPSAGLDLKGMTLTGVYIPTGFDGSTLGFKACATLAGTYLTMYDTAGSAVSYTVGASRFVPLDPALFAGINFIKPVVGSQTGAIILTFATRRLG